ncbi:MAG: hypothetical protein C0606_14825 [Hyphomicrobiales bacterium]|nr:MAG: hypothetical protein C0606_14825 [Hyphomicrobiales bacterium]
MLRTSLAVLGLVLFGISGAAAADANAVKGLIVERCADCHEVPGLDTKPADVGAPTFTSIGWDRETYTEARIRQSLQKTHWPMQQFILSPSDINALVAYFDTLRPGQ